MHVQLEKIFPNFIANSEDVFWIQDVSYNTYLHANPAFEKLWGCAWQLINEDKLGWLSCVQDVDRERVCKEIANFKSSSSKGSRLSLEYHIVRKNGEARRVREISFPLFDDVSGALIGYGGITKDTTRDEQTEIELLKATRFFKYFAEKVRAVFWARDDSCNEQIYLSPGYEKIWGRSRDSLYGNPNSWLDTLHSEDREAASNSARFRTLDVMGADAQYEYRYRIIQPDGKIVWIKDTSFPIEDEANNFIGFAGIAEDITKEVLHEKELFEAKQRAEVANKAKSEFLAMISHEIRTPLNAILGMAQILKSKGLSSELDEYVDIIGNAGTSLLSLVTDILDFARLEAGKLSFTPEAFDLGNLISQIVRSFQYQAREKNIQLTVQYTPAVSYAVIGDPKRIRQVLVNLLGNAIKFTEVGSVTLIVNAIEKTADKMLLEITVRDTGVGIAENKLESIFDKFNQVDSIYRRKHGGIGLGLSITKELISVMEGTIEVESQLAVGTAFRITLPLKLQEDEIQNSKSSVVCSLENVSYAKTRLKVLLVEDNIINQKIAKMMLDDLGCSVDIMTNGEEVMLAEHMLASYDIIFMDVGLPDVSGFDICATLRKMPKLMDKPIIAMTAHILEADRKQAFEAGMNKVMAKPISYDELSAVLCEYTSY